MATYHFAIDDHVDEHHQLELPDDDTAVKEALRTMADLVREEPIDSAGEVTHRLEVRADRGAAILKVSVHVSRQR